MEGGAASTGDGAGADAGTEIVASSDRRRRRR